MVTLSARAVISYVIEHAMEEFCNKLLDLKIDEEIRIKILTMFLDIGKKPGSAFWTDRNFRDYVCITACSFTKHVLMPHHS
jgi:hypothetical protein